MFVDKLISIARGHGRHGLAAVGTCVIDATSYVARFPNEGETIIGQRYMEFFGGKAANVCQQAALIGKTADPTFPVVLVGKIGKDASGSRLLEHLKNSGVDTRFLETLDNMGTGCSNVVVDEFGRNKIIVHLGANAYVDGDAVLNSRSAFINAAIVVCQLEVSMDASRMAFELCGSTAVKILNASPVEKLRTDCPDFRDLVNGADIIVTNSEEAKQLVGESSADHEDLAKLSEKILDIYDGPSASIVTAGARGAFVVERENKQVKLEADGLLKVSPVDTVGAGDSFIGALAASLLSGNTFADSLKAANLFASISVGSRGSQSSYVGVDGIDQFINSKPDKVLSRFKH